MSTNSLKSSRVSNKFIAPYTIKIPFFQPLGSSVDWICPTGVSSVSAVIIAGGGGGGATGLTTDAGGGGGAGGVKVFVSTVTPGTKYVLTVGAGGPAQSVGNPTQFIGTSVTQGGKGSSLAANPAGNGGCGGGGSTNATAAGTGTAGEGNNGGTAGTNGGGGGGGADAAGSNGTNTTGGAGGRGKVYSFRQDYSSSSAGPTFIDTLPFGGGGGGGVVGYGDANKGLGGAGGGGNGGYYYTVGTTVFQGASTGGEVNTGGGGGAAAGWPASSSSGGSGGAILYGFINTVVNVPVLANNNLTGDKVLYCYSLSTSALTVLDFNNITEYSFSPASTSVSGWNCGYVLFPPYGQNFNSTLYIDVSGASGGAGGADGASSGGAGGAGVKFTGSYIKGLSGALYIAVGNNGGAGSSLAVGAGGGGAGTGFTSGGRGGNAGSTGNSGGGGGGGGSSVVISSNGGIIIFAGGGSGGGGGSLNRAGLAGSSVTTAFYGSALNGKIWGYPLYLPQGQDKGAGDGGGGGGLGATVGLVNSAGVAGTDNSSSATGGGITYCVGNGTNSTPTAYSGTPLIRIYI